MESFAREMESAAAANSLSLFARARPGPPGGGAACRRLMGDLRQHTCRCTLRGGARDTPTISKSGFDDSAGRVDQPAFAVDGLAIEPRDEPISDQHRREGAEI